MKALTKEAQAAISPDKAIQLLKEGNERFVNNQQASRDLQEQVKDTTSGQHPHSVVLSCIDSRVSAELVFDQGVGDIFSARVAGNFVNEDILGSIEYGCKVAGSKLVVVLGHTACGAVKGACDDVRLGNITTLVSKIRPAVAAVQNPSDPAKRTSSNLDFVNEVSKTNVQQNIENMRDRSTVLREMEQQGEIKIVGAMYDVADGSVTFYY